MGTFQDAPPNLMAAGYGRGGETFADPFADYASLAMPASTYDAHRWCQHILLANNTYGRALRRVASYFITTIEITDETADQEEVDKYTKYLTESLGISKWTLTLLLDYLCYGNVFFSVLQKFRRYLACPQCSLELPMAKVYNSPEFAFQWLECRPHATCTQCKYHGEFRHIDRRSIDPADVFIRRWDPLQMELIHDKHTDTSDYIWKISETERKAIRQGISLRVLANTPWEVIEAVRKGEKLCFDDDMILHLRELPYAGVETHGWGLSQVLSNFRQAWLVQVMRRYNESLALEDIVPFRLLTPELRSSADQAGGDPLLGMDLSEFSAEMMNLVQRHRQDPAGWHTAAYPVKYQTLGGDASQFAPRELMEQADDCLLNGIGVPVELYRASMTTAAAPVGIRLFESQWADLVGARDIMLRYIVRKSSELLSWEPLDAKWRSVTIIDDAEKQAAKLQLMMSKNVSQTSAMADIGLNFKTENRNMIAEGEQIAELQAESQKKLEAQAQAETLLAGTSQSEQQPPTGAAAIAAAGQQTPSNGLTTPDAMMGKAQTLAQQFSQLPDGPKRSALINLRKTDPLMGTLVSDLLRQMDEQLKLQGGAMLEQQQQQQKAASCGVVGFLLSRKHNASHRYHNRPA